jgi:hypothetical protein
MLSKDVVENLGGIGKMATADEQIEHDSISLSAFFHLKRASERGKNSWRQVTQANGTSDRKKNVLIRV